MRGVDLSVQVFQFLSPLVLGAVTWLAARLAQYINARVKNEYLRGVLVRLDDTVASVVREIQQLSVDALKGSSSDGKVPVGAREALRNAAMVTIRSHLGTRGLADLARVLGLDNDAVNRFIGTKVEAAVHDLRTQQRLVNGVHAPGSLPGGALPLAG